MKRFAILRPQTSKAQEYGRRMCVDACWPYTDNLVRRTSRADRGGTYNNLFGPEKKLFY